MCDVAAPLAQGQSIALDTFTDLTDVAVSGVRFEAGQLVVTFDADLEPDVIAAVRRRIMASTPAQETLAKDIADRAAVIDGWPYSEVPSTADVAALGMVLVAQVKALTRYIQRED